LTLVNEFLDENGRPNQEAGSKLMDRVLNEFGDDSVGELEGVHVGIEDVSQLLTKSIEDRRIGGSPIEQSTRYVKYDKRDGDGNWRYLRPKEIDNAGMLGRFETVTDRAFEVYSEVVSGLDELFRRQKPTSEFKIEVDREGDKVKVGEKELQGEGEANAFRIGYNFMIRGAACDVGRCVLPASTLTHLGMFGNGRYFTHLLSYLKSQDLVEAGERAGELEVELNKVIPTFIQRNKANPNWKKRDDMMRNYARGLFSGIKPTDDRVTLVERKDTLLEVTSSILFSYADISLKQIMDRLSDVGNDLMRKIVADYAGERGNRRDRTGRGIEAGYPLTFDLVGGFAEYRDLERHRILTQQRQTLGVGLGFAMPPEMAEIGMESKVEEVVGQMGDLNSDILHAGLLEASQYATLFNHRIRFSMGMNHREFQHMAELRTQPAGHFSYRSMMMEMADKVKAREPWSGALLDHVNYSDPDNRITRAAEQGRIAGKNLAAGVEGDVDY